MIDAVLLVSFGGPEGPDDVLPFLENVTRGRGIPKERLETVAAHYLALGGVSPINAANRRLRDALERELRARGRPLRVYWGNRHWTPLLGDVVAEMKRDGVGRAVAFATSAFGSYSGCRQYREDIARACEAAGPGAPVIDKVRPFSDRERFRAAWAEQVTATRAGAPADARLVFTAHSIPNAMAAGAPYERELRAAAADIAARVGAREWDLAWQSRSGPPSVPWLEPDVGDHVEALAARGARAVVVAPLGFLQDHVEVVWDLDRQLKERCEALGVELFRVKTIGEHPALAALAADLVIEREASGGGTCADDCCPAASGRPVAVRSAR